MFPERPVISVILPVSKAKEESLDLAVDSVLLQTFADFEFIIVCENGSENLTYLKQISQSDERVRLIINEKYPGIAHSLNTGISAANGEYIARMDADDIAYPHRLERQLDFMENNPDVSVAGCMVDFIDAAGKKLYYHDIYLTAHDEIYCELLFRCCIWHPSVILRRSAFLEADLRYDVFFTETEDFDLWNRACHKLRFANQKETLLSYRRHDAQASIRENHKVTIAHMDVMRHSFKNLGLNFSDRELELLCPITRKLNRKNYRTDIKIIDACIDKITAANDELRIYDPVILKRTLSRNFNWKTHPIRFQTVITLRSAAEKTKNDVLLKIADFMEVHGFLRTLHRTVWQIIN
jgi:glycosyltransferase involved in cell wall biosynthesis